MIKWFNSLDTARRLFVISLVVFYVIFFYAKIEYVFQFIYMYLFKNDAFNFHMQQLRENESLEELGIVTDGVLSDSILALKQLGISIIASFALCYAIFRKRDAK